MPTNDDGNGESPTAITVDASQELDVTALPIEEIEKHPHVQELKKKYSAAHQDMDKTNLSRKELLSEVARLKVLVGEEETPEPEEEPQIVTKAELKEQLWELQNGKDIELYGDDRYKADIERGIPKDYALENAKLRFQSNPDKVRLERQHTMSSGSNAGTRNLESEELTPIELEGIAQGLYSKETALEFRAKKKARGQ